MDTFTFHHHVQPDPENYPNLEVTFEVTAAWVTEEVDTDRGTITYPAELRLISLHCEGSKVDTDLITPEFENYLMEQAVQKAY